MRGKIKTKHLYFALIGVMMAVYLISDVFSLWDSRWLKFITSALVTVYGLSGISKKESCFVSIALIFTLAADVFFVLRNEFVYGVALFIIVQTAYVFHLSALSPKPRQGEILKRALPAVAAVIIVLFFGFKAKLALIAAYACFIGVNFAHSLELNLQRKTKGTKLLLAGFILLGIGDICVGLRNSGLSFVTEDIQSLCYFITWLSYPPSQLLIFESTRQKA